MLTRKQCLDAAVSNLNSGDEIGLRNCGRSLADFCRLILSEVGEHHSGYQIIKNVSIKHRYRLLSTAVPELIGYEKLFYNVQKLRDKIEHDEYFIPPITSLKNLTKKLVALNKLFEIKILPDLHYVGKTPKQKFLEEWNVVLQMLATLAGYPPWAGGHFTSPVIDEFRSMASNLQDINNEVINESRVRLRDIFHELEDALVNAENVLQEANFEASYGL